MVVVFPAPFGPRKPRISPLLTVNDTWSTAVIEPYDFVKSATSINAFLRMMETSGNAGRRQTDLYTKVAANLKTAFAEPKHPQQTAARHRDVTQG